MKKKKDALTISINTRYPQEVIDGIRTLSEKHERSLNGEIVWALRAYLERQQHEDHTRIQDRTRSE